MPAAASVLVVSDAPLGAALLGSLLEVEGYEPAFPAPGEAAADALERVGAVAVLLDCDHSAACADPFFALASERRALVILFSPSRLPYEVAESARERGLPFVTLPVNRDELRTYLSWARRRRSPRDDAPATA